MNIGSLIVMELQIVATTVHLESLIFFFGQAKDTFLYSRLPCVENMTL